MTDEWLKQLYLDAGRDLITGKHDHVRQLLNEFRYLSESTRSEEEKQTNTSPRSASIGNEAN